jgi:glycosyltransferase involved in cell wall biosynthesis
VLGQYDRVLTLTDAERASLCRLCPGDAERFLTVANPYVSDAMLTAARSPHGTAPHIVTLGRMMPQKRYDRLLHAFARLDDRRARLTIVGEGPLRADLERMARTLDIAERVRMPGFTEDVVPWLTDADLFALSSDYEGFPAAVLEAVACNLPVVTTDCFDAARPLLAAAQRCAVVPRADVDGFARAMAASLSGRTSPVGLRDIARPYAMAPALAAHVAALKALL